MTGRWQLYLGTSAELTFYVTVLVVNVIAELDIAGLKALHVCSNSRYSLSKESVVMVECKFLLNEASMLLLVAISGSFHTQISKPSAITYAASYHETFFLSRYLYAEVCILVPSSYHNRTRKQHSHHKQVKWVLACQDRDFGNGIL